LDKFSESDFVDIKSDLLNKISKLLKPTHEIEQTEDYSLFRFKGDVYYENVLVHSALVIMGQDDYFYVRLSGKYNSKIGGGWQQIVPNLFFECDSLDGLKELFDKIS